MYGGDLFKEQKREMGITPMPKKGLYAGGICTFFHLELLSVSTNNMWIPEKRPTVTWKSTDQRQ